MQTNIRITAFHHSFASSRPLAVCAIIVLSAAWSWAAPANKLSQTKQPLPGLGMTLLEMTVANDTEKTADVGDISLGDAAVDSENGDARYQALKYKSATWYGSTFWSGPDWTRVGKDWHHPGNNTPSVRRFVAPRDGRVTIGGRVYKADSSNEGDGVRLIIRHGVREAWRAQIDSNDTKGVEPGITLDVKRGDSIRFIVHKRGRISYDTTHWDPSVTYENWERFQASQAFDKKQQGHDNWHYEMDVKDSAAEASASVYCFDKDLNLCRRTVAFDKPLVCDSRDSLPLLISEKAGGDGVFMAVDPASAWRYRFSPAANGNVNAELLVPEGGKSTLDPGQSLRLPSIVRGSFKGKWTDAVGLLQRLLDTKSNKPAVEQMRCKLVEAVEQAIGRYAGNASDAKADSFEYMVMVQLDWLEQDKLLGAALDARWKKAAKEHLGKTRLLLTDLRRDNGSPDFLAKEAKRLDKIKKLLEDTNANSTSSRDLYLRLRVLKREIVLANPLLDFGPMLFCKRVPTSYSHLVMQYYGWRARPGGGLFVLEYPGRSSACRDILKGKLSGGCVLEPRLSFDGTHIIFSYVDHAGVDRAGKPFDQYKVVNDVDDGFYHIYEVNVDGSGLRQLTSGPYDDLMPTYLPDGGIAFCSTRRRGYARCFGWGFSRRWHVYTLHRMDADGGSLRTLSMHDTNEWFPAVDNRGKILYSRWDYIDRDAVTHQNLWSTRPDGTNPIAVWGNGSPRPHCTFQLQPIPDSNKVVFTASAHHSIAAGPIAMVDPTVSDNSQEAITVVTPEIPFPEADTREIREYYTAPWPLSEKYFLCAYCPTPLVWEPGANDPAGLGLYVIDIFGNREFIYRDQTIGSTNPCPLVARPTPPVLASDLPVIAASDSEAKVPMTGEMILADVYAGLGDVTRGSIKKLRVVQIFPKLTHLAGTPPIGVAGEENARAILGTVPVEPDGSARFTVPAMTPLLFQALDKDGCAYQTMRTLTYVQPGERVSCVGCHENRMTAPVLADLAALRRGPSKIDPGKLGGRPFSYTQVVQPIWDKHCVDCHGGNDPAGGMNLTGTPQGRFNKSYNALCFTDESRHKRRDNLVPSYVARNQVQITPPGGSVGALGSGLVKMLRQGHEDVELSDDEFRRIATWIDMNAVFYGVYEPEKQRRELGGEVFPLPELK